MAPQPLRQRRRRLREACAARDRADRFAVFEQYDLACDETDRPTFEAQLPKIEQTGVPYSNGLEFRGCAGATADSPTPLRCRAPWS